VARGRAETLLDDLGLANKCDQQARTLSGGMRRRLNLAMALVHDPEIVVLDEPDAGLDPQCRVKVRDYIQALAHTHAVILTTHNMDEAERLADRVAIIDHGALLMLDTPDALKRRVGEGDVVEVRLGRALRDRQLPKVSAALDARLMTYAGLCFNQAAPGQEGSLLSLRVRNAVSVRPAIMAALDAAGVQASDVWVRENTLEDVFIQLTGRKLRE